jgi:hypothetical protein
LITSVLIDLYDVTLRPLALLLEPSRRGARPKDQSGAKSDHAKPGTVLASAVSDMPGAKTLFQIDTGV